MIEYGKLFEGVGRFSNSKPIHITLQDNAVLYIAPVHSYTGIAATIKERARSLS